MPQRKKAKGTSGDARASTKTNISEGSSQENHEPDTDRQDANVGGPKPSRGSLKEFVQRYKDRHHYVIEMRIVLVCSFGIFMKLFFSDAVTALGDHSLTYSMLSFAALCVLVIVFSTWLDYFPSRLVDVQLRESKGQGIPMACLLLPTVCCAQLYFSLHFAKHQAGLVQVYLVVLCMLSLCSILATLLHSIPHPNHVMFYNFAVIGLSYVLQLTIGVPMWIILVAAAFYSLLGAWLVNTFPKSFTMGEAMIVAQGLAMLFLDAIIQLLSLYEVVSLPDSFTFLRSESVLYLEFLLFGVAICCLLLSPALYKLSEARHFHEKKFWSGTFILLSLGIGFMLILPWLGRLLKGHNPIVYITFYSFGSPVRVALMGFWLMVCVVTGFLVCAQSSNSSKLSYFKASPPSWWVRKSFHVSALLVYLTGTALDPDFTALASSLISFFFVVAELGHTCRMWPFGDALHQSLVPFLNKCDTGPTIVSHIYLLLGFSLPLWLCPITNYNQVVKLSLYSGVLSLGIGDAVASIVGQLYGRVKWPGTEKTVEGSLASLVAQMVGAVFIVAIDPNLPWLSSSQWGILFGGVAITTSLEAYTWQIDNLVLAAFQYAIIITFLN